MTATTSSSSSSLQAGPASPSASFEPASPDRSEPFRNSINYLNHQSSQNDQQQRQDNRPSVLPPPQPKGPKPSGTPGSRARTMLAQSRAKNGGGGVSGKVEDAPRAVLMHQGGIDMSSNNNKVIFSVVC